MSDIKVPIRVGTTLKWLKWIFSLFQRRRDKWPRARRQVPSSVESSAPSPSSASSSASSSSSTSAERTESKCWLVTLHRLQRLLNPLSVIYPPLWHWGSLKLIACHWGDQAEEPQSQILARVLGPLPPLRPLKMGVGTIGTSLILHSGEAGQAQKPVQSTSIYPVAEALMCSHLY